MAPTEWLNQIDSPSSVSGTPSLRRSPDREAGVKRVHAVFALIGFVVGVTGAIWAYNETSSIALPIFVFLVAQSFISRGLGDVATDDHKGKRFVYFALQTAIAVGVLYVTYLWWETMWLSALLGLIMGAILWQILAVLFFSEIHEEEQRDSIERMKESWQSPGPATDASPDDQADNLGGWLQAHYPSITEDLFMGVIDGDPERKEAMSSPATFEAWLRRHHPDVYDEWRALG